MHKKANAVVRRIKYVLYSFTYRNRTEMLREREIVNLWRYYDIPSFLRSNLPLKGLDLILSPVKPEINPLTTGNRMMHQQPNWQAYEVSTVLRQMKPYPIRIIGKVDIN